MSFATCGRLVNGSGRPAQPQINPAFLSAVVRGRSFRHHPRLKNAHPGLGNLTHMGETFCLTCTEYGVISDC